MRMTITLTKMIHLPTLVNRFTTSDLCVRGAIPHISPEIPTRLIYVFHENVSKMIRL